MDQTRDIFVDEFTTGITDLSREIGGPEDFDSNFITSEPAFPTKPSREPPHDRSPDTEDITTDYQRFTVPFSALVSTDSPAKPEDSYLPPPADESDSNDLITDESPTEQVITPAVYTTGSFTLPTFLQATDKDTEVEMKKELVGVTEPLFKEADRDSLSGQGKMQ